ncbi:MAG: cytochrome c [Armatimonadota bacterium]|nr:cytochrome c [Armatimonadota bacterium]MDW8156236.1 cytochrome c [Armatimonadota bacterium]
MRTPPLLHGTVSTAGPGAVGGAVLAAGLLLAAYGVRAGLRTAAGRAFFLAGVVAAGVSAAAALRAEPPNPSVPQNPVPPTAASMEFGRRLYQVHCAACHGQHGSGDGPAAAALAARPPDLRLHVPMHADGQLFMWVSEGIPGTLMPGFWERLTEEERWHVVNYLRLLALSGR